MSDAAYVALQLPAARVALMITRVEVRSLASILVSRVLLLDSRYTASLLDGSGGNTAATARGMLAHIFEHWPKVMSVRC